MEDRNDELLSRYGPLVSYLKSLGHSTEEAEDLAQEAFLRHQQHRDRYRGQSVWVYLKTMAHNLSVNRRRDARAAKRSAELTEPLDETYGHADTRLSPEAEAIRNQELAAFKQRFAAAMRELPEESRQALILRMRDHSYEEIRQLLGLTMDAVKSSLLRAKRRR